MLAPERLASEEESMEELLGIVGFGIGASLSMAALRAVGSGARPVLREVMKAGIVATDAVRSAASNAGGTLSQLTTEARESVADLRAEVRAERDVVRTPAEPQKIVIARE